MGKNNKFLRDYIIVLGCLLILFGCATTPLTKPNYAEREKYVVEKSFLTPDIEQAILKGKVIVGMTKEQVRISWGEPTEIYNSSNSNYYAENEEGWYYKGLFGSLLEPSKWVFFKDGIVVEVEVTTK